MPFSSRLHIIPSIGDFKEGFKIGLRDAPKPFQKPVRIQLSFGSASVAGFDQFWTPQWPPQAGPRGVPKAFRNVFFAHWPRWRPPELILEASRSSLAWILDLLRTPTRLPPAGLRGIPVTYRTSFRHFGLVPSKPHSKHGGGVCEALGIATIGDLYLYTKSVLPLGPHPNT